MANSFYQGKNGSFKLGSTATASVENWSATVTNVTEEFRFFGDSGWAYPIVTGQGWSGNMSGRLYLSDDNQLEIWNTVVSGTADGIDDVRLYINDTIYLASDDSDDDAAVVFTSFVIDAAAGSILSFSADFLGRGAVEVNGL